MFEDILQAVMVRLIAQGEHQRQKGRKLLHLQNYEMRIEKRHTIEGKIIRSWREKLSTNQSQKRDVPFWF
jgi:hypothetical protein